jgi:SAM-dependent methyltransferase
LSPLSRQGAWYKKALDHKITYLDYQAVFGYNEIMRDYYHIERYLNKLAGDIYPQPPDPGHQTMLKAVANKWLSIMDSGLNSILDVGCGQGQAIPVLGQYAGRVEGVTLGTDADVCRKAGHTVYNADMSFLPYRDGEFDLIFARHVLEHSPMPVLTLMEWRRVARQWLLLVMPNPQHYGHIGRNHYYVLNREQILNLFLASGWHNILEDQEESTEIRFLCEKAR